METDTKSGVYCFEQLQMVCNNKHCSTFLETLEDVNQKKKEFFQSVNETISMIPTQLQGLLTTVSISILNSVRISRQV